MTVAVTIVDYLVSTITALAMIFTGITLLGLQITKERLIASCILLGFLIGTLTQINHVLGAPMEVHFLGGMFLETLVVRYVAQVPFGIALGTTMIGWLLLFVSFFLMLAFATVGHLNLAIFQVNPLLYLVGGIVESIIPIIAALVLLLWQKPFALVDFSKTSPTSRKTVWLFDVFLAQTMGLVMLGFLSAIKRVPLWQAFPVGLPGLLVWAVIAGLPIMSIMVIRQLNTLYQAELNLREAEKMAMIGRLSAALAHEVRNPVLVIKGYLKMMQQLLSGVPSLRHPVLAESVRNASDQVAQMERLLTDFLVLGRPAEDKQEDVDLEVLLREVAEGAEQVASARQIHVSMDLPPDRLPRIKASRKRLQQVLSNLVSNAVESCAQDDSVRIGAEFSAEKQEVTLTVADTGAGIPPENLDRIFEPFFTTKDTGTGLGLSVVKKIVNDCGGSIDVKSELGKGTEFRIQIPVQVE